MAASLSGSAGGFVDAFYLVINYLPDFRGLARCFQQITTAQKTIVR